MQFFYTLLPLLPLVTANGRLRFNAFDHVGCQGFEETYDLNPATVKGNFPGKIHLTYIAIKADLTVLARTPRRHPDLANVAGMSPYALHGRQPGAERWK